MEKNWGYGKETNGKKKIVNIIGIMMKIMMGEMMRMVLILVVQYLYFISVVLLFHYVSLSSLLFLPPFILHA